MGRFPGVGPGRDQHSTRNGWPNGRTLTDWGCPELCRTCSVATAGVAGFGRFLTGEGNLPFSVEIRRPEEEAER
jgi:hypothetical protein